MEMEASVSFTVVTRDVYAPSVPDRICWGVRGYVVCNGEEVFEGPLAPPGDHAGAAKDAVHWFNERLRWVLK